MAGNPGASRIIQSAPTARETPLINFSWAYGSTPTRGGGTVNQTINRNFVEVMNHQTGSVDLYLVTGNGTSRELVASKNRGDRGWTSKLTTGSELNSAQRQSLLRQLNPGTAFNRRLDDKVLTTAAKDFKGGLADAIDVYGKSVNLKSAPADRSRGGDVDGSGTNSPAGSGANGSTPSTTPEEQKALVNKISSTIQARTKYDSELLKYPEKYEGNDYLTITMIRYVPDTNLSIGTVAGAPTGESGTVSLGGLGALRPSERFGNNNEKKVTLATIDLPIPSNLLDGNLATWGNGELNPLEAYGAGAFTRLMTSGGDVLNQIGREASAAANAVKGNADGIKTVALNAIVSQILGKNPKELLSRSTGAVINPNQELLFLGPGLRTFSFSFKMTPRSEKEATSVRKIIRTLKQGMAVKRAVGGLFLAAPNVFELEFKYVPPKQKEDGSFERGTAAIRHPYLPVLKVCALQNVSVNYMPDGSYMTYGDGSMVGYDMTLTFAELEPIFDTDYSKLDQDTDAVIGY